MWRGVCVHGGGACIARDVWWWGDMHGRGACMAGDVWWWGGDMRGRDACMARGHAWQGGMRGREVCVAEKAAIAAGGAHPTGMHSCLVNILKVLKSDELPFVCIISGVPNGCYWNFK